MVELCKKCTRRAIALFLRGSISYLKLRELLQNETIGSVNGYTGEETPAYCNVCNKVAIEYEVEVGSPDYPYERIYLAIKSRKSDLKILEAIYGETAKDKKVQEN